MSSIILEKKQRCPNGERWNNKTKKCEPKKSKKYTFEKGRGRGQVQTKKNRDPVYGEEPIFESISEMHPTEVDVNTPNPLLTSIVNSSIGENLVITPTRVNATNPVLESLTREEVVRPINKTQRVTPMPINKTQKKRISSSDKEYIEAYRQYYPKYESMTGQELRDIWAGYMDLPKGIKTSGKFSNNKLLINEIIRLEILNELEETKTEEEEPLPEKEEPPSIVIENFETGSIPVKEPLQEEPLHKERLHKEPFIEINDTQEDANELLVENEVEEVDLKQNNKKLMEKELKEYENNKTDTTFDFLYPELNDPNFNIKITKRKEFNDSKYDGKIQDIKKQAELLCNANFELMPHQLFIKNFLSFQTPYNSLLLFNALGTGKTCSAIGVAEEMRSYMKQIGISQRIMVIASPNVQANFKLQLFDERKLKEVNGIWELDTCNGNSLLKEINPTNLKGIPKERIISQIKSIINTYYVFMGYIELANYIDKKITVSSESGYSDSERKKIEIKLIRKFFNNRLIIIDEVHNIRMTDDNKIKRTATLLMKVAKFSNNMRLLLLSATPMYNSYKEIIWLTRLMNINDKRAIIDESDVFDKSGMFKEAKTMEDGRKIEGGRELLQRKLIGYVSYVRGENPYTFPYRIYPNTFSPENTITPEAYPKIQMNKKPIDEIINHVPVYVNKIGEYQQKGYEFIMDNMRKKSYSKSGSYGDETTMPTFENMDKFGYTLLEVPLESLNIVYPNTQMDFAISAIEEIDNSEIISNIVGKKGLSNIMSFTGVLSPQPMRYDFDYYPEVVEKYGKIFIPENIGKYSSKISKICDCVKKSKGIIIIYSQYIDGGIVPLALALEEMGFSRHSSESYSKSLLKTPAEPIDSLTLKPKSETPDNFKQAKYVMITGDKAFSPNNAADIKYVTNQNNKNGELVKVILISKAGSEGLDFKNIRQIHILEPWYNMNRIEQIIGRGVRNLSHCSLPFEERNVEIYLHGTLPLNGEEPADLYVYRLAEKKALQIGKVTRLLKETAVDCLLNIGQTNFTVEKLLSLAENQNIKLNLSSQKTIDYKIGDKPFTDICDYMETCDFTCSPNIEINEGDIIKDTYNNDFVKMNYPMILKRIRQLYREQFFYDKDTLISSINIVKEYPREQIYYTLSQIIDNKNEYIFDKYGRRGYLINKDKYYVFQPIEITDENASIFERSVPVDFKRESLLLELPQKEDIVDKQSVKVRENDIENVVENITVYTYQDIMKTLTEKLDIVLNNKEITTGDTDWYKHASQVIDTIKEVHEIPNEYIIKYITFHYLDTLSLNEKKCIIDFIYSSDYQINPNEEILERLIMLYFEEKVIMSRNIKAIIISDKNILKTFIFKNNQWVDARQVDNEYLLESKNKKFIVNRDNINNFIGFMNLFKNNEITFKTKDISQARNNKGALCSNAGKPDIVKRLNSILQEKMYNDENTENILKIGLCVILEFLVRYFTEINYKNNNKVYFFDSEMALYNKIVEI